ncbi:hypothetical protein PLICRDRAFT_174482 [Plicaturopsis crispa FD-325 SS-3]|nr:hypothetical protein PLICRDRAFT_174482 [Plicaturopsis crispa FD-325 SS-3]
MSPTRYEVPAAELAKLSPKTQNCVESLLRHELERPDLSEQPPSKLAAVLVVLFERAGLLRVILTTRSKTLRAHPGETALPGGKVDPEDKNFVETAYREANEEVGLPLNSPHVHTLCLLEPFLSKSLLLVTPVVAILTDVSVLDTLVASPSEVDLIFDHPLEALLDPSLAANEPLVSKRSSDWPFDEDLYNVNDRELPALDNILYRTHRFRSSASPIKGLTSDILIKTAQIAYGKPTTYELYAPGHELGFRRIRTLLSKKVVKPEDHSDAVGATVKTT